MKTRMNAKIVIGIIGVAALSLRVFSADGGRQSDSAASRIPTAEEINAVQPKLRELTEDDFAALKAKKKTNAEVADALLSYISEGDDPAAKYLLRQKAFRQYVLGNAYDKAAALYTAIRNECGMEYALGMPTKGSLQKMSKKDAAAMELKSRILADEKSVKGIVAIKAKLEKSPDDGKLHERLGMEYIALGDWESALNAFRNGAGDVAKIAKWETSEPKSGDYDAAKVAGFWWALAEEESKNRFVSESIKVHAANWYKKAINNNLLSGIDAKLANRRIEECESFAASAIVKERASKLYMVIDLTKLGKKAVSYLDEAPKGGWGDEYKTTKIVLRRIAPGSFEYMPGRSFKITKPFYIGVFEVTQKQYEMTAGYNPSTLKGPMRPVETVWWSMIRGKDKGLNWPKDNQVDSDSYLGKLRKKIGLEFDLPTEVQWEYACRAGTTGDYNVDGVTAGYELLKIGNVKRRGDGPPGDHVKVGGFLPNAWGLYDMHGNVAEWCLDRGPDHPGPNGRLGRPEWTAEYAKETETDPKGPATGNPHVHVLRGGSVRLSHGSCTSSACGWTSERGAGLGFRLACPADAAK